MTQNICFDGLCIFFWSIFFSTKNTLKQTVCSSFCAQTHLP